MEDQADASYPRVYRRELAVEQHQRVASVAQHENTTGLARLGAVLRKHDHTPQDFTNLDRIGGRVHG